MLMHRLRLAGRRHCDRFTLHDDLDGLEGAACYTAPAKRTALGIIFYFPWQIIDGYILRSYCFHLCTSSSLSMTTISRSFG